MESSTSLPSEGLARFVESEENKGRVEGRQSKDSERPGIDKRTNRTPLPPVPGRVSQPSARLGPSFFPLASGSTSHRYNQPVSVDTGVEPRTVPRAEHPISRKDISSNALKVLYRLHNAGYKAYLVGGSVRDLMLGRPPKDFDVGTNARPNEIRRLFSQLADHRPALPAGPRLLPRRRRSSRSRPSAAIPTPRSSAASPASC